MTVTVANGVAVGNYPITVKANSPGQAEQTATVTLSIQSAGAGTVTWTFCSQSGTPTWAAYQNGTGGAWTQAVGALRTLFPDLSYNYFIHSAPNRVPRKDHWHTLGEDFHWHLEIMPRFLRTSGFEWGSGFYILPTSPEHASQYLREV